jgi:hypothetical protein
MERQISKQFVLNVRTSLPGRCTHKSTMRLETEIIMTVRGEINIIIIVRIQFVFLPTEYKINAQWKDDISSLAYLDNLVTKP